MIVSRTYQFFYKCKFDLSESVHPEKATLFFEKNKIQFSHYFRTARLSRHLVDIVGQVQFKFSNSYEGYVLIETYEKLEEEFLEELNNFIFSFLRISQVSIEFTKTFSTKEKEEQVSLISKLYWIQEVI